MCLQSYTSAPGLVHSPWIRKYMVGGSTSGGPPCLPSQHCGNIENDMALRLETIGLVRAWKWRLAVIREEVFVWYVPELAREERYD